jgi:hypothetical protein
MRLTNISVRKLRSGSTVWRCLINPDRVTRPQMIQLSGTYFRERSGHFRHASAIGSKKKGYSSLHYLDDLIGHGRVACFTTYRSAIQYCNEVNAGRRPKEVLRRVNFLRDLDGCLRD